MENLILLNEQTIKIFPDAWEHKQAPTFGKRKYTISKSVLELLNKLDIERLIASIKKNVPEDARPVGEGKDETPAAWKISFQRDGWGSTGTFFGITFASGDWATEYEEGNIPLIDAGQYLQQ